MYFRNKFVKNIKGYFLKTKNFLHQNRRNCINPLRVGEASKLKERGPVAPRRSFSTFKWRIYSLPFSRKWKVPKE